ncbi:HAE1 family hydrophobic/amphiphilic exporter-1 [Crenobacter luteus]|uniref:Acriflavin resistance protein n=1 Tax=Crenobacter luteus TaxID=1452487 RepID=A0A165EJU9_9NEIS|nr:efflux RND transporter permease subunit [Crenobacter luteus]KZE24928.1 acriflavin resistance protein [Crenobacter luteus]TCP15155.1 HAE1 family hydrophobic/amphiphilic exporter-1 [Crenobacter luteus]
MNAVSLFIHRHVLAFVLSAVVVIFGVVAYQRIGVDRYPAIEQPQVSVSTTLAGATPDVIDQSVTQVIESAVNSVPGVDILQSSSAPGRSTVTIVFTLDKNIDVAFNEVQTKLETARRRLPDEADPPVVTKADSSAAPILWLTLTGERTERDLYRYANNVVKKQLETIDGVGAVNVRGRGQRVIRVEVDPLRLAGHRLTASDVEAAIRREHRQEAGGILTAGPREYLIDLDAEFHSVAALEGLVVGWQGQAPVKLADVARVIDGEGDLRSFTRLNGTPAVSIGIVRIPNTNTVAIAGEVLRRLDAQIRPSLPPGMTLTVASNTATFINEMVGALKDHLFEGTLLAALVVWAFLRNARATVIVATAIPVSLLGAVALMYFLGYTFNTITLLALLLLIGVVVDDAIVVLEAIHRREEGGEAPLAAAEHGTREVVFAVVAATLSLVAIFLPVVFLSSTVGRLFNAFAIVVSFGVLVSLFVSVTLTPMLCSRFLKAAPSHGRVYRWFERQFVRLEDGYRRALAWSLGHRRAVLAGSLVLAVASLGIVALMKTEFYPEEDEGRFLVQLRTPVGSSVGYTDGRARAVEAELAKVPEIQRVLTIVGGFAGNSATQTTFVVGLSPRGERERSQGELIGELRRRLSAVPGARVSAFPFPRAGESRGGKLKFAVVGPEQTVAARAADALAARLSAVPGIGRLDAESEASQPMLSVTVRREAAARLGLSTQDVLSALKLLTAGANVARFSDGDGERYDIRVKAADATLSRAADLGSVYLRAPGGALVPLASVADVKTTLGPSQIDRLGLMYAVSLSASPEQTLGEAMAIVRETAAGALPPGYRIEFLGEGRELARTGGELFFVLALSSLMLYLILAAQFNSFVQPAIIMLAEPLAVVGGLFALWAAGQSLNVYSAIGLVLLIGLVAKNAILLVDVTNQYRARGLAIDEALSQSCPVRLRPVLMTSLTVVLAMLPAALGFGAGAETNGPLAIAVIGGMVSSTALTLLVIPCAYSLVEGALARRRAVAVQQG